MAAAALCACASAAERTVTAVATFMDGRRTERTYTVEQKGDVAAFAIPASDVGEGVKCLDVIPGFATARRGESGYFLLPNGLVGGFRSTNGVCEAYWSWDNSLPIYGMKTPRETFCMIAKGMRFLYSTRVVVKDGVYRMGQRYELNGDAPYEDFLLEFTFLPQESM